MHTLVSVKNPMRGGGSAWPASSATCGSGPEKELPRGPAGAGRSPSPVPPGCRSSAYLRAGLGGDAGAFAVTGDERRQLWPPRTAARADVDGQRLDLLDVHVPVERDGRELVEGVALGDAVRAPVIGHADLVDDPPADHEWRHPVGDEHLRLDRAAGGHQRGPPPPDATPPARAA